MKQKAHIGQIVEFTDPATGKTGVGQVRSITAHGEIGSVETPEGDIIEGVGLIFTIIRSIGKLILIIRSLFSKKAKSKLRAIRKLPN